MQQNVSSLLVEAGTLLVVGMSVVFCFLALLIGAITLIAKICSRYPDEPDRYTTPKAAASVPASAKETASPALIAAIGAAVNHYRKSQ